jgi:hypothetical protein
MIVLVTCDQTEMRHRDDLVLQKALQDRGEVVDIVSWTNTSYAWQHASLLIIRSAWDYVLRPLDFFSWLDRRARESCVLNAPHILTWNSNKRYLIDIQQWRLNTIPTIWCSFPHTAPILLSIALQNWGTVVIKPTIGAGSLGIMHVSMFEDGLAHLTHLLKQGEVLLQPFLSAFQYEGEYSFIFIHRRFSHAVRKIALDMPTLDIPSPTATHVVPVRDADLPPDGLILAQRAMQTLPNHVLFARVDVVRQAECGTYCINEVELIEPQLFLWAAPHAVELAAQAIVQQREASYHLAP